jgi:hypothetical protein
MAEDAMAEDAMAKNVLASKHAEQGTYLER